MKRFLKFENFLCAAVMLFSVLITNNTLMFGTNASGLFNQAATYLSLLAAALFAVTALARKKTFRAVSFVTAGALAVLLLLSALVNKDLRMGYLFKIALIAFAWGAAELVSFKKFARVFDGIVTVLSAASLILLAVYLLFPAPVKQLANFQNSSGLSFFHTGVAAMPTFYGGFPRNFGIFREPGVYQMYLMAAMLFQLVVFEKPNYLKLVLYTLTVLTTLSTVGFLGLGLMFLLFLVTVFRRFSTKQKWIFCCAGGILVIGTLMIPEVTATFYELLISKWNIHGASGASSVARYASIAVNLLLAVKNPLVGIGITGTTQQFPVLCEQIFGIASNDNTNTLLINFAMHGFIVGILFVAGYLQGALKLGKNAVERGLIALIILLVTLSQNYSYTFIIYLFLFYGFSAGSSAEWKNPLAKKKK